MTTRQENRMKEFMEQKMKYLLLAAAAASCIYGAMSGQMEAVLNKAATICLECIGIG